MRRYGAQWRLSNACEVEFLVRLGLSVNEVQQMAILGAFLYSVPFMEVEAPKSYDTNTKSYIQLLGISEEIQYVLKTQIFLYANILNSWGFYIQRAELIKGWIYFMWQS